jgi:hypothetical protein
VQNFSEIETLDDGRVRPKHVVRKGTIINYIVDGNMLYEIKGRKRGKNRGKERKT